MKLRYTTIADIGTEAFPNGWIYHMIKPGVFVKTYTGKIETRRAKFVRDGVYVDSGVVFIPETDPWFNYYLLEINFAKIMALTMKQGPFPFDLRYQDKDHYLAILRPLALKYIKSFL